MTTKLKTEEEITLVPHEIPRTNSELSNLLRRKVEEKYKNSAIQKKYVCREIQELKIIDSSIEHSSGNVIFTLRLLIDALKIFKGKTIEATITDFDDSFLYCKFIKIN